MTEQQTPETILSQWLKAWSKAAEQFTQTGVAQQGGEWLKQWQELFQKTMHEVMHSDSFQNQLGRSLELGQTFRAQLEQVIARQLAAFRIPTPAELQEIRTQLEQLSGQLQALNDRLRRLEEARTEPPAAPPTAAE